MLEAVDLTLLSGLQPAGLLLNPQRSWLTAYFIAFHVLSYLVMESNLL